MQNFINWIWCYCVSTAYGSGRGWRSQQTAQSNVISLFQFRVFIFINDVFLWLLCFSMLLIFLLISSFFKIIWFALPLSACLCFIIMKLIWETYILLCYENCVLGLISVCVFLNFFKLWNVQGCLEV